MNIESKKIFIVGESAGATLILLLLQKLKTLGLPQPCGAIPISPMTDLSASIALKTEQEDGIKDAMFNVCPNWVDIGIDKEDRKQWNDAEEGGLEWQTIIKQGKYSPLYGDWKGVCPLYIAASENEVLINDSKAIIQKCKQFNIDYQCDFDPYLLHAPLVWCWETGIPEARDKVIMAIEWMKTQLKLQNTQSDTN